MHYRGLLWSRAGLFLALLVSATCQAAEPAGFASGFEPVEAIPLDYCSTISLSPLVQPRGRQGVVRSWNASFYGADFYTPTTYLHPTGSITMGDAVQPGRWLAVAFTAGASAAYRLDWAEAQSVVNNDAGIRYSGRPAHSAFVTVSPCPGDFRREDNLSIDGFLKRGCRRSGNTETIRFRTDIALSTTSNCALQAGRVYYLNIGFFLPGETDPMAHTCISGDRCEINIQPQ